MGDVLSEGSWNDRGLFNGRATLALHTLSLPCYAWSCGAAYFWTAVDRASDLDEIEAVRESRVRCGEALAEVIRTLKLKVRRKI